MEPEIVLTEISQTKKDKCHMFSLMRSRYTLYVNTEAELLEVNHRRVQVRVTGA